MRILIHGINFAPELTGIGKYTGEMAMWLASRGHEVRVVTAPPYYPEWQIGKGHSAWRYKREAISSPHGSPLPLQPRSGQAPGEKGSSHMVVYRCPLWVPAKLSGMKRLLHLASFALSSLPVMLSQIMWRPDVVLVVQPPFFCAPQAWLTARLSGAKAWLHIQDFEVDAAFELGLLPDGKLRGVVHALERWLMRRFDRVSAISERMVEGIKGKGTDPEVSVLFPNWVDTRCIYPADTPSAFRAGLGIPESKVVVLYSGNMGEKQGLEILVSAAKLLAANTSIQFVLCGEGAAKRRLRNVTLNLRNVIWLPLQPAERLNDLLNMADIHLLLQRASAADLVMPSKVTGMLATGRPVIATAAPGSGLAGLLSGCGLVTPPGDAAAFANAIVHLASKPDERRHLGQSARARAVSNFDRDVILGGFERALFEFLKCD